MDVNDMGYGFICGGILGVLAAAYIGRGIYKRLRGRPFLAQWGGTLVSFLVAAIIFGYLIGAVFSIVLLFVKE